MAIDVDECFGNPSTENTLEIVANVPDTILSTQMRIIHDICSTIDLSYGVCQRILFDELNMRRIVAQLVPMLLSTEQNRHRVHVCTELREITEKETNFSTKIITGDESWVEMYDSKATVIAVEHAIVTEESTVSSKQRQVHVDLLLWY